METLVRWVALDKMFADQAGEQAVCGRRFQAQRTADVGEPQPFGMMSAQKIENTQAAMQALSTRRRSFFHDVEEIL